MKKLSIGIATLCAVALTGCSATPAGQVASAPAGTNTVSQAPAAPAAQSSTRMPEPTATPTGDGTAKFGAAYTWDDGISLTIGKPAPYTPSDTAFTDAKAKKFVVMDVRVVNKTGKPWDPALLYITMQSANQEASQVFDSAKLPERPNTKLLDGREATFKVAFAVANPNDLVVEARPDFTHESVLFKS